MHMKDFQHVQNNRLFLRVFIVSWLLWFMGYVGLSVLWSFLIGLLWYLYEYQLLRLRDVHQDYLLNSALYDPPVMSRLLKSTPQWLYHADVHNAVWLNSILQNIWPYLSKVSERDLIPVLQDFIDSFFTDPDYYEDGFITRIKLADFIVGDRPILIQGIKTLETTSKDRIALDVNFMWSADTLVTLKVYNSLKVMNEVKLDRLFVSGTLRLVFTPLICEWPCFSTIHVSFISQPVLDFSIRALKVNVAGIPGLHKYLSTLFDKLILDYLILPQKWVMPVLDIDPALLEKMMETPPVPIGMLRVFIFQGVGFPSGKFRKTPSSFYKLLLDSQEHTGDVIHDTVNPIWNDFIKFDVFHLENAHLELKFYEWKVIGKDRVFSSIRIPLTHLNNGTKDIWLPLSGCSDARVHLEISYEAYDETVRDNVHHLDTTGEYTEGSVLTGTSELSVTERATTVRIPKLKRTSSRIKGSIKKNKLKLKNNVKRLFTSHSDEYLVKPCEDMIHISLIEMIGLLDDYVNSKIYFILRLKKSGCVVTCRNVTLDIRKLSSFDEVSNVLIVNQKDLSFSISNMPHDESLVIDVLRIRKRNMLHDEIIGRVCLPMSSLISSSGNDMKDFWISMTLMPSAKLHLQYTVDISQDNIELSRSEITEKSLVFDIEEAFSDEESFNENEELLRRNRFKLHNNATLFTDTTRRIVILFHKLYMRSDMMVTDSSTSRKVTLRLDFDYQVWYTSPLLLELPSSIDEALNDRFILNVYRKEVLIISLLLDEEPVSISKLSIDPLSIKNERISLKFNELEHSALDIELKLL